MLKISHLTKAFGNQLLFDDISFHLNPGERLGLVGRNGHGKTTLYNLITGIDNADAGEISVPRHYTIGHLDQEVCFRQPTVLEEGCLGLPPGRRDETWHAEKILSGLGFSVGDMARPPQEFSGGFQGRINLAKTLVSQPNLLLLDEPTNFLDIVSIRWMVGFLKSWKGELMLISHDRHFMDSVATHIMGIHRQKVRKIEGNTGKLFEQIRGEEGIHEKTRLNEEKKRKQEELFIRRFRAKARLAGMVQSRIKTLEKRSKLDKLERIKTLQFSFRCETLEAKGLMHAHNLSFTYGNGQPALIRNFSLTIGPRERVAVVGKNGKGKSTLLRLLAGNLASRAGSLKSHPLLKIGHFEQGNVGQLDGVRTVEEEILASDPQCDRKRARDICGAMMFEGDQALKKISVLSGGEKSRVCLAKLLVSPCHLLLLDEPTNHLDPESCEALMVAIGNFPGAVVIVTHNELFLKEIPNRLVVFDRGGHRLFESSYPDFLTEVGWSSEDSLKAESSRVKKETAGRKAVRRRKARAVQEKSRALRGFQHQIGKLEDSITAKEKAIHELNQQFTDPSVQTDGTKIADLSQKLHHLQMDVENEYLELDKLTTEYEELERMHRERLKGL